MIEFFDQGACLSTKNSAIELTLESIDLSMILAKIKFIESALIINIPLVIVSSRMKIKRRG